MTQSPDVNELWQVARQSESAGKLNEAEQAYRRILAVQPAHHEAWHALGILAVNANKLGMAAEFIDQAVLHGAGVGLYWRNLGEIRRRLGQLPQAVEAGEHAVALLKNDPEAWYNLGLANADHGQYDQAAHAYRQALELAPNHGLAWNNLGSAIEQRDGPGDKEAARNAYARAVAINPSHAEAQNNLGAIQSEQGQLDEARASFEAAIAARGDFVEAHYNYSSLHKYTRHDPHLALLEGVHERRDQLGNDARVRYSFALGKALDDIGEIDRAFAAYEEGNRLQHALLVNDEQKAEALTDQIIEVFNSAFFAGRAAWKGSVAGPRTPIFIVGMPRSGTTLLEQILCSHPSVHGAGELGDLNAVIQASSQAKGLGEKPYTELVQVLSEDELRAIGDDYLQRVWALSPTSRYITDKMPANFFYLGLLHLALPHAKIIHALRDPMDSCFSCYSRLFNDTMAFAYDQGTLGRYYVRYRRLMQHWHSVLPAGSILDLPYEHMVADTETQARRVLEFVGLPWDPNCLNFHENTRLVKTASVAQVRKPIYTTSVARWKLFARHLRPLYDIVKDWRDASGDGQQITALMNQARVEDLHQEGIKLYRQNRFADAVALFDQALASHPDAPAMLNSRGFALQDMGHTEAARDCYLRAVELAPGFAMARLNLGLAQLKLGEWAQGWENYESRWTGSAEAESKDYKRPACPLPQWDGHNSREQSLLVIVEQGFGDTFQFGRYLGLLGERFSKVGLVCWAPAMRLMEWSFGEHIVMFHDLPKDFTGWDYQCTVMSLPRAFATRVDNVPAEVPYLKVAAPARAYWRQRLDAAAPGKLRIGIAWAGRPNYHYNARRSLPFEQLAPLLDDPRVAWVSLQKWLPGDTQPVVPGGIDWLDWTSELNDFAASAALVANLDLVISVDSVIVHLAGALDVPVWMLDRFDSEWRWLKDRLDSPWYPRLKIIRQAEFGQWPAVIQQARENLRALPVPRAASSAQPVRKPAAAVAPAAPMSPATALQLASQLLNAGRGPEAEKLLAELLRVDPRNAHAIHLLGVVVYQAGRPAQGLGLITQALGIAPDVPLFHSNLAEMNRQQGNFQAAVSHGERAVELDPAMASAHSNLGVAYYDAKDYDRAQAAHERALALQPGMVQSLNNLASVERARKNPRGAIEGYQRALAAQPQYVESMSNLGAVLIEEDRADEASVWLEKALALSPESAEVLCNLGLVRLKQDRYQQAYNLMVHALRNRPDYPEGLIGLGRCLSELDRNEEALAALRHATELAPEKADAWSHFATLAMEQGEAEQAEAAYQKALAVDPDCTDALTGLGNLRLEEGKADEATRLLEQALSVEPDHFGARFHLSQARKVKVGDSNFAALQAMDATADQHTPNKRVSLHYALGKCYDDTGDYARAFPHFLAGAKIKRDKLDYDADADATRVSRIIELFDRPFLQRLSGAGDPSDLPVFVLGMPRSGTTLTEQIIASHPQVYGAGELRDLMELVQLPLPGQALAAYPDNLIDLTPADISRLGADYIARLRRHSASAKRITDKMPANYMAMGLIPALLPNAKIIHVRRDPVDTCVSCFTRLFNRHQEPTYNLAELGRHYASYARLMEHWRSVLPAGSFMEVQYEDIVADMEGQARRLVAFCDLEWDPACLSFHTTQRNIRTASVTQVRQPIYTSSVQRWRHYESFLGPLLEALGEYRPSDS